MNAELILVNASLWTGFGWAGPARALAVGQGRILAVGSDAEVAALRGAHTAVVDVAGRTVLPGFQDAHCHPPMGGIDRLRCDLSGCSTPAATYAAIRTYAASHPDAPWLLGGGWRMYDFGGRMPTAADLDAVTGDRPAYFTEASNHTGWANSAALRIAGVDAATADPADGYLERDAAGDPTGILHDGATALVARAMPQVTPGEWAQAILLAQDYFLSCGVTAWQDACVGEPQWGDSLEVYRTLAQDGRLHLKTVGALWWWPDRGVEQVEQMIAMRERSAGRFRATTAKIMVDGIIETGTAALAEPYCGCLGDRVHDACMVGPPELDHYVRLLDAAGFQVHFHAIGDTAVRSALDAVAGAREVNGPNDNRHHIAHVQLVDPADLPRFAALGVTANCQPLWAAPVAEGEYDLTLDALGPNRYGRQYPFGALVRAGARLAFGSDWNVSGAETLPQLEVAVTRRRPGADGGPVFLAHERLSLDRALHAFTMGSAYVNHLDDVSGSLTPGKLADLCILDRDVGVADPGAIGAAQVEATLVEGVVRFRRGADLDL